MGTSLREKSLSPVKTDYPIDQNAHLAFAMAILSRYDLVALVR